MSKLQQQITNNLKQAMLNKEAETLSVLRMLISSIRNREIALRKGEDVELADEQIVKVLRSEIKKRKDSILAYEQGNRRDLAEKEKSEMQILEKYLPPELSEEEIEKIIKEVLSGCAGASMKAFGKIMGQVMAKVSGKADGGMVGGKIKEMLEK
ncbi:GatB/YqeY domain-containing protein [Candidatus Parcubacteria bacterium]|nr:GatB/YqeY domain-containing protein [Candidatus Parcubacteria bacterium]